MRGPDEVLIARGQKRPGTSSSVYENTAREMVLEP